MDVVIPLRLPESVRDGVSDGRSLAHCLINDKGAWRLDTMLPLKIVHAAHPSCTKLPD